MKIKFKYLIIIFTMIILLSTFSFATNTDNNIMLISEEQNEEESSVMNSDLYVEDNNYEIKNIINGNVFTAVNTLNIDPNDNGGIIEGNLFATANNVNIKSNISYSETEKDDLGNPAIVIDKHCTISGNVFVLANKFVLESGSVINGDLYIYANDIELLQGSTIYGNVFIVSNKLTLNSEIGGSLYASVNNFDMQYFGFVSRDLHLNANKAFLDGYVYRNSFINAKSIITYDKFTNQEDFNITDADTVTFSGEINGNAVINAKNINLKNTEDVHCKILGNLSYSSEQNLEIPDGVVSGEVNQSDYNKSNNILSNLGNYALGLIASLICVYIVYLLIKKFIPKYLDIISNISALNLLKYFGIGLGFMILIPIITIILFVSRIGFVVGVILLLLYMILIIITEPIFVISVATFLKNKVLKNFNVYLNILVLVILLSLLKLIPYVGVIIYVIVNLIGFGMIIKNLITRK